MAGTSLFDRMNLGNRLRRLVLQNLGVVEEDLAVDRRRDAAGQPIEQRNTELGLEVLNALGQCRL